MSTQARLTDSTVLLQATGGNIDVFRDLLHLFLSIFPDMVEQMSYFFAAGNFSRALQQAHDVKGCLYLVGATRCAERMESIEMAACRDRALCHSAEFEQLMDEMRSVIEEVENDLSSAMLLPPKEMC